MMQETRDDGYLLWTYFFMVTKSEVLLLGCLSNLISKRGKAKDDNNTAVLSVREVQHSLI